MASQEIEALASALARLPGLGPRSARRAVLWLIKRRETSLVQLAEALEGVRARLVECTTCGNVDTANPCSVCTDPRREHGRIGPALPIEVHESCDAAHGIRDAGPGCAQTRSSTGSG